jgi:hypothetical protein
VIDQVRVIQGSRTRFRWRVDGSSDCVKYQRIMLCRGMFCIAGHRYASDRGQRRRWSKHPDSQGERHTCQARGIGPKTTQGLHRARLRFPCQTVLPKRCYAPTNNRCRASVRESTVRDSTSRRSWGFVPKFIFGPAVWLRGLIKPPAARALAYIDWSSQEVAIAAALSGDSGMRDAVESGDPYLTFAKRSGLAPPEATKATHATIRDVCKTVVLGTNYGMGPKALAFRTGLSVIEAQDVLRKLATAFPTFWDWAQHVIDVGILTGRVSTVFGWPIHITDNARPTYRAA